MTEPIQRFLEKRKFPRWASILTIVFGLIGIAGIFGWIIGNPIAEQVNKLVKNAPMISSSISTSIQQLTDYVLLNKDNFPQQVNDVIEKNGEFSARCCDGGE
ncbi:AI-2E family transporter [Lysinibacillus sp. MHQ-1]|nr:AI-2E family transporter [Lysinibacillus sp. MHQ-1]